MVVSFGEKTYLRRRGTRVAGANMRRDSGVGVYCRMALIVPCCTSGLGLASSYSRSFTSSAVRVAPSCSTSSYCLFSSINNYILTTHPICPSINFALWGDTIMIGCLLLPIIGLIDSPHNFIMASPAKLFSCVEAEEICKSPLNLSPAKHQYSFSKSDRFKVAKP